MGSGEREDETLRRVEGEPLWRAFPYSPLPTSHSPLPFRAWHCDCPKRLTLHPYRVRIASELIVARGRVDGHDLNVWGLNAE